ncbi:hypothetical protein GCM10011515_11110 [Tsuneonella deserti]|uniref:Uncharacterized protein n=1 Tax=Tsuneonella deserti TaxID=2035528 RepID=A0ABQ1S895_9SPHN|nr:hypothetical protein [Tsuneonella deserti]GGD93127.1 hypothetical protein GCM10011515_11110 [Tsuneonella deserti]
MAIRKLLIVFALVLFGLAIAFFIKGDVALGASMVAIATSQIAVFTALAAKAKLDAQREDAAR